MASRASPLALLGVSLFVAGFFLTRREMGRMSECNLMSLVEGLPSGRIEESLFLQELATKNGGAGCWSSQRYEKVFMFIIDALRVDFVSEKSMPYVHSMINGNSSQTKFFTFRADPPTTTSQRLKGLTTGSLPTFIDISENFESHAVIEDNWVDILLRQREQKGQKDKISIFLGDDTWALLFPGHFNVSLPFDSFDTLDLDTVDDGIEAHLWPLLQQHAGQWDLVVTHFLGVDHIGHTHDAQHPLMRERLRRMDTIVKRVVEGLPDDALLLLYGDHGMTDDGNHGGATTEETDAALVAYSRGGLGSNSPRGTPSEDQLQYKQGISPPVVSQIDLVPTLSLLLGLPVPFASLGQPIAALFPGEAALTQAQLTSALQVMRYLRAYGASTGSLQEKQLGEAAAMLDQGLRRHMEGDLEGASVRYEKFLDGAARLGRAMFTKFNVPLMLLGLVLQAVAIWLGHTGTTWGPGLLNELLRATAGRGDAVAHYFAGAAALALLHALAGISDTCIRQEHWLVLAASQALFCLALRVSPRPASSGRGGLALLGMASIWGAWLCSSRHRTEVIELLGGNSAVTDIISAAVASPTGLAAGQVAFCGTAWAALLQVNLLSKGSAWSISGLMASVTASIAAAAVVVHSSTFACECYAQTLPMLGLAAAPTAGLIRLFAARVCMISCMTGVVVSMLYMRNQSKYSNLLYHVAMAVVLVTGEGAAIVVALLGVHLWCVRRAICLYRGPALSKKTKGDGREEAGVTDTVALVGFALHTAGLARFLFFSSQHRLEFGSLQLEAGFVGLPYFHFYYAGAMLSLNTFGPDLLALLAMYTAVANGQEAQQARKTAARAVCLYRQVLVLVSCLTALVLRRHLMVWAVFAPKLAFEACMLGALSPWLMG